jgi:hypothetical protein
MIVLNFYALEKKEFFIGEYFVHILYEYVSVHR